MFHCFIIVVYIGLLFLCLRLSIGVKEAIFNPVVMSVVLSVCDNPSISETYEARDFQHFVHMCSRQFFPPSPLPPPVTSFG